MMEILLRRGTKAFAFASILTIVVAIAHMTGLNNDPFNDDWAAASTAMQQAKLEIGPMTMSFQGLFVGLWVQVGVLLVLLGVKNLAVLFVVPGDLAGRVARTLCVIDCITCLGLAVFFALNAVPPALVSFAILSVAYLVGAITSSGKESG